MQIRINPENTKVVKRRAKENQRSAVREANVLLALAIYDLESKSQKSGRTK